MSLQDGTETSPQIAAPPAAGDKTSLALLVIATAQLMLVLDRNRGGANAVMLLLGAGRPPAFPLVELTWQGRITMVGHGPLELAVIDAAQGQRRQRTEAEPAHVERLKRRRRLNGAVAAAEEEQLVDVHRQGRRIVLELTIPAGDQLHRRAVIPGFLQDLPGNRG
jgi:hypothetical protein